MRSVEAVNEVMREPLPQVLYVGGTASVATGRAAFVGRGGLGSTTTGRAAVVDRGRLAMSHRRL